MTLLTIVQNVPVNLGCHELFGFDILLDENAKPILLEVNCSPAMAIQGDVDRATKVVCRFLWLLVKKFLLNDICEIVGLNGSTNETQIRLALRKTSNALPAITKSINQQTEINKRLYQGVATQPTVNLSGNTLNQPTNAVGIAAAAGLSRFKPVTRGSFVGRNGVVTIEKTPRNAQNSNSQNIAIVVNRRKLSNRRFNADVVDAYKNAGLDIDEDFDDFADLCPWNLSESDDEEKGIFHVNLATGYNEDDEVDEMSGIDGDISKEAVHRVINDGENSESDDELSKKSKSDKIIGKYRERALRGEKKSKVGGAVKFAESTNLPSQTLLTCHMESSRAPHGDFERIFPFNDATEKAADSLAPV